MYTTQGLRILKLKKLSQVPAPFGRWEQADADLEITQDDIRTQQELAPLEERKSPAKVLRPGEHSACKELGWRAVEAGGWATKGLASILSLMEALEI